MQVTPARLTASRSATARARSRSTGFSQKIALPACGGAHGCRSACVSVLEAMTTAPIASSAKRRVDGRDLRAMLRRELAGGGAR